MLKQHLVSVTASVKFIPVICFGFSCLHISDSHLLHIHLIVYYILSTSLQSHCFLHLCDYYFLLYGVLFLDSPELNSSNYNNFFCNGISSFLLCLQFLSQETFWPCVKYVRNTIGKRY